MSRIPMTDEELLRLARWIEQHTDYAKGKGLTGKNISKSLRKKVYQRDGNKCLSCGTGNNLTLHHVVPRSAGGKNIAGNLETHCRSCHDHVERLRTLRRNAK